MKNEKLIEFADELYKGMLITLKAKNHDYTGNDSAFANFEQSKDYGVDPLIGLCLRIGDKMKRVQTYCKRGELQASNEGIEDAFEDLIGYSTIALAMLAGRKYP